jgi:hypothetical protein
MPCIAKPSKRLSMTGRGRSLPKCVKSARRKERRRKDAEVSDHLTAKRVFSPPDKKAVASVRRLEKKGIPVPLALQAWIEEVGSVNLAGAHPRLCFWADENFAGVYADPLMIMPDLFEMNEWGTQREAGDDLNPLDAVLGWDAVAKARLVLENRQLDYGYTVTLPNAAADAALKGERHNTTFVNYLRIVLRCGGFPGWEQHKNRPEKELKFLTEGLLPV